MMGGNATLLSVPANSWQIRLPSSPEDSIDHAIPNDLKWANLVFHPVGTSFLYKSQLMHARTGPCDQDDKEADR